MKTKEDKYEKYIKQIKNEDRFSRRWFIIFAILIVSLSAFFAIKSSNAIEKKNETITEQTTEIKTREDLLLVKDSVFKVLKGDVETIKEKVDTTKLDSTALKAFKNVYENLITYSDNSTTVVRYYKRKKDDPKIEKTIQRMNFYLNERPVEDDDGEIKVNSIWYGDSVDINKVRALATELIKTNNDFKFIKNFKLGRGYEWKVKAIEIGYEENLDDLPTITNENDIEKWIGFNNEALLEFN
ncbi:hypothetical protein [Aquimarina algiphila]|uniref:Uncharacterized protein n=1 Tax=Aquimarina algiphila TaxID=2047982 RepID=A0A554VCE7_9FLAO|nr:hypothetical protein [Aquimarina algiphila]TSE04360.1 hypothetical protein FOF46_26400 [Aquimarina algiphila]